MADTASRGWRSGRNGASDSEVPPFRAPQEGKQTHSVCEITRRSVVRIYPPQPKQIPLLIQSCRQRYRYFTAKNIDRISTYKNKRCILGVFHPSCNAFFIVFIAPPRDLTQYLYRPIVKQPHFVKQPDFHIFTLLRNRTKYVIINFTPIMEWGL